LIVLYYNNILITQSGGNTCGKKRVLPQGVAHQAARRVFLVGVKNRLMPRELAATMLQV
jgi:hypothetical protein